MGDNEKLQTLWDERLIAHRMLAFGRSLDDRDWAAHATCFTDPVNINFKSFTGREEVRVGAALWARFAEFILSTAPSHHILGNFEIAIDGDHARARVYMISSLWTETEAGRTTNRQYGWYDVGFERRDAAWKISRLKHDFQGVEGNAASLETHDPEFAKIAQEVFSPANMAAAKAYLNQAEPQ
ncbi:MAG TPA: nuclear transport factor 2 family protein [Granulicella sp.]|nr:nuclear transport factor 2 family protein [Granulicella sp.]